MSERPKFTYNPFYKETSFGAVSAVLTPVEEFREKVRTAMCLPDQGVVIGIHMPTAVNGNGNNKNKHAGILGAFRESFTKIASELEQWGLKPHSMVAVTHIVAAGTSKRYGFEIRKVSKRQVDHTRLQRARKGYKLTGRYRKAEKEGGKKRKKMGPIFACYQSFDKFMQEFGNHADFVPEGVSS